IGIVAAGRPHRSAGTLIERQIIPRVAARLVRSRNAVKAPCLFAGFRIERRNVGAAFAASADTLHDLPFGNEWPACELPPIGWIGDWLIPHQGACFDIESDDVEIRRARKQLV